MRPTILFSVLLAMVMVGLIRAQARIPVVVSMDAVMRCASVNVVGIVYRGFGSNGVLSPLCISEY